MPIVGRLLRQQMLDGSRAESPTRIRERRAHAAAAELAIRDRADKFPRLTADNFDAANAYQEKRIAFHKANILREVR